MNIGILQLIQQHRNTGVVVDTNLLLLYIVGKYNKQLIDAFKRTRSYSQEDYLNLLSFLTYFPQIVTTPHILTQVTDLLDTQNRKENFALFKGLQRHLRDFVEHYLSSRSLCQTDCFLKFGLADATLNELAQSDHLVLTDDFPLYGYLSSQGLPVINFNHLRTIGT